MAKKKKKCGKKKDDCGGCFKPVFYYVGDNDEKNWEQLCKMSLRGIKVYAAMGTPPGGGCPPGGCK